MGIPTAKIEEVLNTVDTYKSKIDEIKTKYISKINEQLEKLENIINSSSTRSQVWIDMQVTKITKKIQYIIDALIQKIKEVVKNLQDWAETAFDNISASLIISMMTKLGVNLDRSTAMTMSDMIPLKLPSFDSLVPEISLELEIPDINSLASIGTVTLPRL